MSFTRKMLKAMGIEEEKIDQIIDAHREVVDSLKVEKDKLSEKLSSLKDVEAELNELKDNSYEDKYNKLKAEYEDYKTEQENKEIKANKEKAFKGLLSEIGISEKRLNSVLKISDLKDISLNKDGTIKDAEKLKDNLKEEWADFITKEDVKGAKVDVPPVQTKVPQSREDIMAIKDPAKRQEAIANNHELFNF